MTAYGPQVVPFIDETQFKAGAECVAFGETMKDRTADFVRGMFDIRWDAIALPFDPYDQDEKQRDDTRAENELPDFRSVFGGLGSEISPCI